MQPIDLAARMARDAFDQVIPHPHGFTAIRDRDGSPVLLFALAPIIGHPVTWQIRREPASRVLVDGHGLAALASTLIGAGLLTPPMDARWRAAKATLLAPLPRSRSLVPTHPR